MNAYRVFGGFLWSDVPFPELPQAESGGGRDGDGHPTYTLLRAEAGAAETGVLLGEESVGGAGHLRLFRAGRRLRLDHDKSGAYEVDPKRGLIEWHPPRDEPPEELVRTTVLGRVLPVLLHGRGLFLLHASGVSIEGRAVGFAAPKGHGKSTLAVGMAASGGGLVADDTLVLEIGGTVRAWPGDQQLKLWDDAAEARDLSLPNRAPLAALTSDRTTSGREKRKYLLTRQDLPGLRWEEEPLPLAALYFLVPTPPEEESAEDDGRERSREDESSLVQLSPIEAAPVLVSCSKLAPLLHDAEASSLLEQATRLAEQVPVYAIEVTRDLSRLSRICADIRQHVPSTDGSARAEGR